MEDDADKQLDRIFKILANRENDTIRPRTLTIKERNVSFNKTCGRVADCTFDELCDRVSGPSFHYHCLSFRVLWLSLSQNRKESFLEKESFQIH